MEQHPPLPRIPGLELRSDPEGRLLIFFTYDPDYIDRIRLIPGRQWHPEKRCWSVPHTETAIAQLRQLFAIKPRSSYPPSKRYAGLRNGSGPAAEEEDGAGGAAPATVSGQEPGSATAGTTPGPASRFRPNPGKGRPPPQGHTPGALRQRGPRPPAKSAAALAGPGGTRRAALSPNEGAMLAPVDDELRLRGYSMSTRKSYRGHLLRFQRYLEEELPRVGEREIREYLLYLIDRKRVSRAYLNQAISAIKFYFDRVLRQPAIVGEVPRPRRETRLPLVLSRQEVLRIFDAISNPKHRALLMVAYSAGLRVSEVVRLKASDLDTERGLIRIHRAKGRKDRYVPLSVVALETVRLYEKAFRPAEWLFPGAREGKHLTTRSVQKVLSKALVKAKITKRVTVHTSRHSYATHLLEDGTDLRYVQELLGHRKPETTMIYTHVVERDIRRIRSPLDNIRRDKETGGQDLT